MSGPRAVVIPFGVPEEGRGLGLGLAALLHGFAQIEGQTLALAQLHSKKKQDSEGARDATGQRARTREHPQGTPVEAFVPPNAWRDLAGAGNAPSDVHVVVTGAFEPPSDAGRGLIQLLAFDARDGATRAKVEAQLDGDFAGAGLLGAFDALWKKVGGELGRVHDIGDLRWDALESVLRAERCALHDPSRGGPHDRLAAMVHLGRAIGDAPGARFPAGRLAALALETGITRETDPKLAASAVRALERASIDAPGQLDLVEAMAALEIRIGRARDAERRLNAVIAAEPKRARAYALLSEALRTRGDRDGALATLQAGIAEMGRDVVLLNERGVVSAESGDLVNAAAAWHEVLARDPRDVAAFANLSGVAMKQKDTATSQVLVDHALSLSATHAHPDVLRRAIHLALVSEAEGLPRSARVARLARALVDVAPDDAWGAFALAKALAQLGDTSEARAQLTRVEQRAPATAVSAEAQRARFALDETDANRAIEASLRAALHSPTTELDEVAARARRQAREHGGWMAWLAAAVAERRQGRWASARAAANAAIVAAPGCATAHAELVTISLGMADPRSALRHAERALALEGETPRTLGLLARALHATGRSDEAHAAIAQALALDESDDANQKLATELHAKPPTWKDKLQRLWRTGDT